MNCLHPCCHKLITSCYLSTYKERIQRSKNSLHNFTKRYSDIVTPPKKGTWSHEKRQNPKQRSQKSVIAHRSLCSGHHYCRYSCSVYFTKIEECHDNQYCPGRLSVLPGKRRQWAGGLLTRLLRREKNGHTGRGMRDMPHSQIQNVLIIALAKKLA